MPPQTSKTYTRTDILRMNESLLANKTFMEVFHDFGIERDTITKFLVGLDIDETIVCPIHNEKWEVIGNCIFYDFKRNPKNTLSKPSCSGLLGFSKTGGRAITMCKDIIDMMLAFQHGIPYPVVATDRNNPPHFIKTYQKINFLSDKDDLVDLATGQAYSYGIDDLHNWLKLQLLKPIDDRVALAEITPPEITRDISDNSISYVNPALVNDQFYWMTYNKMFVLCPDGKFRRSSSSSHGRKIITDNDVVYFKVTPCDISRQYVFAEQKTHLVYSTLWRRFHRYCNFLAEDQCKLLAAYVMYLYVFPCLDTVVHLHLVISSQRQRDYLLSMLMPLVPSESSFKAKGIASICSLYNGMNFRPTLAPFIIMDNFDSNDFDRGLTMLVDQKMCPYPRPFAYKAFKKENKAFRSRLYSWSLCYRPNEELEMPIKSLYSDILMPLLLVLKDAPSKADDLKVLRNTVARSRSYIRYYKKEDVAFAGYYKSENDELVESNAEVKNIPTDIQSQDDPSSDHDSDVPQV